MGLLARVRQESASAQLTGNNEHWRDAKERLRNKLFESLSAATIAQLASKDKQKARVELEVACEAFCNEAEYEVFTSEQKTQLIKEVLDQILGLGPLEPLMNNPAISEIMVNGTGSLFYEEGGSLHEAQNTFETKERIMLVVDRILAPLGRRLDEASPIVNARLSNGDRVNAVIHPIGLDGPYITIRRFSGRITSLKRLVELGALPTWYAQLLSCAVRMRLDIAVAGGTGSGKTTLLNALSLEISPQERIVTIEDSAELSFKSHPHVVRLETRAASIEGKGEVSIRDLVINALRMRPDRIIVGEVRGAEAIDMLQAMNTGHDGSLTTLHAGSAQEAISRLVLMARFGMDLPASLIEEQISTALNLIVMSKRCADGRRFITSLVEVRKSSDDGVELFPLVEFDEQAKTWKLLHMPAFVEGAQEQHLVESEEVTQWRKLLLA